MVPSINNPYVHLISSDSYTCTSENVMMNSIWRRRVSQGIGKVYHTFVLACGRGQLL